MRDIAAAGRLATCPYKLQWGRRGGSVILPQDGKWSYPPIVSAQRPNNRSGGYR